jgi:hypothetical protein
MARSGEAGGRELEQAKDGQSATSLPPLGKSRCVSTVRTDTQGPARPDYDTSSRERGMHTMASMVRTLDLSTIPLPPVSPGCGHASDGHLVCDIALVTEVQDCAVCPDDVTRGGPRRKAPERVPGTPFPWPGFVNGLTGRFVSLQSMRSSNVCGPQAGQGRTRLTRGLRCAECRGDDGARVTICSQPLAALLALVVPVRFLPRNCVPCLKQVRRCHAAPVSSWFQGLRVRTWTRQKWALSTTELSLPAWLRHREHRHRGLLTFCRCLRTSYSAFKYEIDLGKAKVDLVVWQRSSCFSKTDGSDEPMVVRNNWRVSRFFFFFLSDLRTPPSQNPERSPAHAMHVCMHVCMYGCLYVCMYVRKGVGGGRRRCHRCVFDGSRSFHTHRARPRRISCVLSASDVDYHRPRSCYPQT